MQKPNRPIHNTLVATLFPLLIVLAGCSGSEVRPSGTVSGTVTFGGEPVTEGQVQFNSEELGVGALAKLDSAGKFTIEAPLALGKYTVTVLPPPLPAPEEGVEPEIKEYPNIPEKYRTESTTDLTAEVKEGDNHFPFDMKP